MLNISIQQLQEGKKLFYAPNAYIWISAISKLLQVQLLAEATVTETSIIAMRCNYAYVNYTERLLRDYNTLNTIHVNCMY